MAITSSAKKASRSSARKRVFNLRRKEALKSATKTVLRAVSDKNIADVKSSLQSAYAAIDKAMKRGIIKKNTAARKKSRLVIAVTRAFK